MTTNKGAATTAAPTPVWFCVMCGKTDLNATDPCTDSPSYHWRWDSHLQAVITGGPNDGKLMRDVIAAELRDA